MTTRMALSHLLGAAIVTVSAAPLAIADTLEERAVRDIATAFAEPGLEALRAQLYAPGKSDEEKNRMIEDAVQALAECKVEKTVVFADEHQLSATSLLRWQARWQLTPADQDTLARLDTTAFRAAQAPCSEAFLEALPVRVSG